MIYIGFLRGINVGGNHKLPMSELKKCLNEIDFENVKTILNSGNFIFESNQKNLKNLESKIEKHLSEEFKFPVPTILVLKEEIKNLTQMNPFEKIKIHKDIRLYISFLKDESNIQIDLPYISKDKTFQILSVQNKIIISVLDLSKTKTPKGMDELEKLFGKNITTRNWNTVLKINELE